MKPKLIEGNWYIEVLTMELGNVLLLDSFTKLAIPIQFETENEALEYIKTQKSEGGILMLEVDDIVRSKKQEKIVIPYLIKAIEGDNAKCINLIDTYDYTIPLKDLYLWIVE
jgi:hypothetical protein